MTRRPRLLRAFGGVLAALVIVVACASPSPRFDATGRRGVEPPTPAGVPDATPSRPGAAGGEDLTGKTVVSLTFDDASASQATALEMLRSRGMAGTLYVSSGLVGTSAYYLMWPQTFEAALEGHDIGGHTVHHENLVKVDLATARSEVCQDRAALTALRFGDDEQGQNIGSFAYPEGGTSPEVAKIVADCGYIDARAVGGLNNPACRQCPYAESIPPHDPFNIRTAPGVSSGTTLADLQASVVGAEEHGGGWVPMVFHGICATKCTGDNSLAPQIFTAFLDWLQQRRDRGTVVRTVDDVMRSSSRR
ncbi:polysaccharide deacetylase family protein [Pseudonocardia lutea]|uniref:Polysaccharide deacetylase family protein n=1 Tax=Pseudonocardia lutea TaxID=2172015 RepID=A0ABW1I2M3_9PSEU